MGLYRMLSHAGELHQAVFIPGWLDDLTVQDPYYILPVSLMGLMFLRSALQRTTGDNAQQKMLTYGLPLMFGVMGLWFPAGLTVYITTNTVLGLLHTLYMKRSSPPNATLMPKLRVRPSSTGSSLNVWTRRGVASEMSHSITSLPATVTICRSSGSNVTSEMATRFAPVGPNACVTII